MEDVRIADSLLYRYRFLLRLGLCVHAVATLATSPVDKNPASDNDGKHNPPFEFIEEVEHAIRQHG
jgi:hypothetical protein